jgi:hypothetical protein
MIDSIKGRIVSLLFTFTLAIQCLALEGDNQIWISFSIWSPSSMDLDLVDEKVSDALRSFLCQDANLVLLDIYFRSVCYQRAEGGEKHIFGNIGKLSMLDFIKQTDPIRSYLKDEASNVLISDLHGINGTIEGSTWDVSYDVLQVGTIEIERARMANVTDEMVLLEHTIQQRLNLSIIDGIMNQRLRGTEIIMGNLGQEFGTLPESSVTFEEENNIHADPELNYKQSALILRYIGIVMLVGSILSSVILALLGRRDRMEKEGKEMAALDPEYQRGLVTEQGVNLMLDKGRRESERMSSHMTA